MPDCTDIDAQIVDLLYGELDAAAEASLREHIASCDTCTATWASFSRVRALARQLPVEDAPIAVSNILLHEAGKHARRPDRARHPISRLWVWLTGLFQPLVAHPAIGAMATLVLIATVGGVLYSRTGSQIAEPIIPTPTSGNPAPSVTPVDDDSPASPAQAGERREDYPVDIMSPEDSTSSSTSSGTPGQAANGQSEGIGEGLAEGRAGDMAAQQQQRSRRKDARANGPRRIASDKDAARKRREPGAAAGVVAEKTEQEAARTWAGGKHAELRRAVTGKRCADAATIANDIRDRDRAYYDAELRDARELTPCRAYIASETRQRARRRAARKTAKSKKTRTKAPAQAVEADMAE